MSWKQHATGPGSLCESSEEELEECNDIDTALGEDGVNELEEATNALHVAAEALATVTLARKPLKARSTAATASASNSATASPNKLPPASPSHCKKQGRVYLESKLFPGRAWGNVCVSHGGRRSRSSTL